ncbi:uncharacterized protein LOC126263004 [Schistocerca nitens]|uniref:uncharacterized protein LOC126263004 n=1 Tax=Schistocerca nitens TaxID=7011 RepID=UPI002119444B|nr:uncharacterized protein LOC126263004 [Schistocerca nitens]
MAASLGSESQPVTVPPTTAAANLLSLAGDALCLAVTALRLRDQQPPQVSLSEVACHDCPDDCWIIINDRVYDITDFLSKHPGGEEILLEYAGRDASLAFQGIGHGPDMVAVLEPNLVGVLPPSERLFDANGRIRPVEL